MASAAYLGLFPYVTLRDYRSVSEQESANHTCDNPLRVAIEEIDQSTNDSKNPKKISYIHLFVGGSSDNLGLNSVRRILQNMTGKLKPKKLLVLTVTAGVEKFAPTGEADPSGLLDRLFLDLKLFAGMDGLHLTRDRLLRKELDRVLKNIGNPSSEVFRCEIALTDLNTGRFSKDCRIRAETIFLRRKNTSSIGNSGSCSLAPRKRISEDVRKNIVDREFWKQVSNINTTLAGLNKFEIGALKRAAKKLVDRVKEEICDFVFKSSRPNPKRDKLN